MEYGETVDNYYSLLQVAPSCDAEVLEKAYRHLAQLYHPDHSGTADVEKFKEINQAYSVLRNPEKRAEYDKQHGFTQPKPANPYRGIEAPPIDERSALADAETHEKILTTLYKRRRERAANPGVGPYAIQEMLDCTYESFEFHTWYLKSKGFVEVMEEGTIAITVEGVDHVIAMSRQTEVQKLLAAKNRADQEDDEQ